MRAIIPAAGVGTRLRPFTYTLPKPLVSVAGKPILGHILDELKKFGVTKIGFVVGDESERITRYVKENYEFESVDSVYQEKRTGLGHAVYLYLKHLVKTDEDHAYEPMLIVLSDTIFEIELGEILKSSCNSIGVHRVKEPWRFGIVVPGALYIKSLVEKPPQSTFVSDLAIVGVYFIKDAKTLYECLEEMVSEPIENGKEYDLTRPLQMMLDRGKQITAFNVENWYDCGTPEAILDTNRRLLERHRESYRIRGSVIKLPVSIAKSAKIENSIVGPHVSIADGVEVSNSIIRDAIVNDGAKISNALIESSIIGEKAVFVGQFLKLNIGDSSEIKVSRIGENG